MINEVNPTIPNKLYGSTTLKGSSRKSKNYPIEPIETAMPITNPQKILAKLLESDSYVLNRITSPLFIPIDLNTPSSH